MRIFILASNIPFRDSTKPGVSAIHIQLFEFIKSFIDRGNTVIFQAIFNIYQDVSLQEAENEELDYLKEIGVKVLPPISSEEYMPQTHSNFFNKVIKRMRVALSDSLRIEDFYPTVKLCDKIAGCVRESGADVIFTAASPEGIGAVYGFYDIPKLAFQGDIDFAPAYTRMKEYSLFARSRPENILNKLSMLLQRQWFDKYKRAHLQLMQDIDVIANATACNVDFYKGYQHPRSIYIGTTWKDLKGVSAEYFKQHPSNVPLRIIGHVGNLYNTGSTYGLRFLLKEVVPALKKVMKGTDYEIHIIGGGKIHHSLESFLNQDNVVVRGFVKDLDNELMMSDVFLFLNNAGAHLAAYSRHIIAWSMGLCLIVHENSVKTIPQIKDGENALVGADAEEIARQIYRAATDKELNMRLREAGICTFKKHFTPQVLADILLNEMEQVSKNKINFDRKNN